MAWTKAEPEAPLTSVVLFVMTLGWDNRTEVTDRFVHHSVFASGNFTVTRLEHLEHWRSVTTWYFSGSTIEIYMSVANFSWCARLNLCRPNKHGMGLKTVQPSTWRSSYTRSNRNRRLRTMLLHRRLFHSSCSSFSSELYTFTRYLDDWVVCYIIKVTSTFTSLVVNRFVMTTETGRHLRYTPYPDI